jgi:hypothetical protein
MTTKQSQERRAHLRAVYKQAVKASAALARATEAARDAGETRQAILYATVAADVEALRESAERNLVRA